MSDWIFQKLKLKIFLPFRNGISVLFNSSESLRKISFRTSSLRKNNRTLLFEKCCWRLLTFCQKMTKNVVLNQDSNQGPSRKQKKWDFLSKAFPLSHGGITFYSIIIFVSNKLCIINMEHELNVSHIALKMYKRHIF